VVQSVPTPCAEFVVQTIQKKKKKKLPILVPPFISARTWMTL
jgi:hypothetical protein